MRDEAEGLPEGPNRVGIEEKGWFRRVIGNKPDFIERGVIVQADLNPRRGSEQSGQRPAVVVSSTAMTAGPTLVVIPFTARVDRPRPYEVVLSPEETGLPEESTALVHHIRVLDKAYIVDRHRGRVIPGAMERIDKVIRLVLDVA